VGLNLHTHLEGWVRPETAADLAASMGVPAPDGGWEHALRMTEPADLTVFLAHVAAAYPVLGSAEAMRRVAREAVEDAAADRCDYLELRFGPSTHARPGFDIPDVIAAACAGLEEGSRAATEASTRTAGSRLPAAASTSCPTRWECSRVHPDFRST